MAYTRQDWAIGLLHALGNSNPSPSVVNWVIAWSALETGGPPGASYNLLNTTQRENGSTNFNSVGVQNFPDFNTGVQANAQVLNNGRYPSLVQALRSNDISSLNTNSRINSELSIWGTGPKQGVISTMAGALSPGLANQSFSGNATGVTGVIPMPSSNPFDPTGLFIGWGEHIAVFVLALLLVIVGLVLLGLTPQKVIS